jgi:hypothetical protein
MKVEYYYLKIICSKEDSSYVYFTLEANEGVAFYSTSDEILEGENRILHLWSSLGMKPDLIQIMDGLKQYVKFDILEEKYLEELS